MTSAAKVYPHVVTDPEVMSLRRPCIEGTRIRVMDVVAMREEGLSPEQIVEELSSLSGLHDVYAALLYYHGHKDEFEAAFAEDARFRAEWERIEDEHRQKNR